jgi:NAD(P)-dependent dehydrogenase (short-subunit alcohol dehydrogenase family)
VGKLSRLEHGSPAVGRDASPLSDPLFDVSGRVVALTGACGLVGRTLARAFHERGAGVVVVDVAPARPEELAESLGGDTLGLPCDVADASQVEAVVAATLKRFGQADVLVNGHQYKPEGFLTADPETLSEELWDAVIDVNLKGTFLTCREFGRAMLDRGEGSIVNFASTYGLVSSNPDLYEGNSLGNPLPYSASKGGVVMLTKYLGAYWGSRGVRVNCVTPHGVWNDHEPGFERRFSEKSPMKRMMKVDEVVGAVLFLASGASSYATASNVLIEGGWTAW